MRRKKTLLISEVLREYRKEMNIDVKLKEVELLRSWEDIAGRAISKRTSKVYIKNRTLFIHLTSSVVRNELLMIREVLKARLNEVAGEVLVDEIVLK